MFLTKDDLNAGIRLYRLNQITDSDDTVIELASAEAQSHLYNVLDGAGYNATTILGQSGSNREAMLIGWLRNLTMYKIYERIPDAQVPERVVKNYDDTLQILRTVADGRMNLALPRKTSTDGGKVTKFRGGSAQSKRSN